MRLENCCAKCRARSGISPSRSRKGGTLTETRSHEKIDRDRNFCSLTIVSKSRFVAAIKRASVRSVLELPSRSNSLSCSTRVVWSAVREGFSAYFVQKMVPPLATSNRPIRCAIAPVNAPFSCPKQLAFQQSRSEWPRS